MIADDLLGFAGVFDFAFTPALADFVDHLLNVFDAHVGLQEFFLPLAERSFINLAAGNEERADVGVEDHRGFAERTFELV